MNILIPTSYSKATKVWQIAKNLSLDPFQICNTEAAFKGYVMEFVEKDNTEAGVGSLDEFYKDTKVDTFKIEDVDGNSIIVIRSEDGKWKIGV